jgi:hypothetical protein
MAIGYRHGVRLDIGNDKFNCMIELMLHFFLSVNREDGLIPRKLSKHNALYIANTK